MANALTDMETCYKVFRREVLDTLAPRLRENRFGIEPEITAKLARMREVRLCEVPVYYLLTPELSGLELPDYLNRRCKRKGASMPLYFRVLRGPSDQCLIEVGVA